MVYSYLHLSLFFYLVILVGGFASLFFIPSRITHLRGSMIGVHSRLSILALVLMFCSAYFNQTLFGGDHTLYESASTILPRFFFYHLYGVLCTDFDLMITEFTILHHFYEALLTLRTPLYTFEHAVRCDGLSIGLLFLSALLFLLCVVFMPDYLPFNYQKEFFFNFYLLHFSLFFAFITVDIFLFYIAFELVLVPLFYLIGRYGSGQRRIRASYLFFFYTLIGSLGFLLVLIYMMATLGTTHLHFLLALNSFGGIPFWFQVVFFICFFVRMSVKIPLFPVHLWLPEAHVEAPTVGSVLLAGILLKLGTYGFFRFVFSLFFSVLVAYQNFFVVFLSLGFVLASFSTVRQRDMKRVIAYSSVSHMTMVILGLFLLNRAGVYGSLFLMFSHGFISSALFFLVGVVYRRYHTRLIKYFSGLRSFMPYFAFFFLYFSLANMRFPGTAGFIGEFLVVVSAAQWNFVVMFFMRRGMFINRVYSLWLRNRILFGLPLREYIVVSIDLSPREFVVLFTLFFFTFLLGVSPMLLFNILESALILI